MNRNRLNAIAPGPVYENVRVVAWFDNEGDDKVEADTWTIQRLYFWYARRQEPFTEADVAWLADNCMTSEDFVRAHMALRCPEHLLPGTIQPGCLIDE